MKISTRKKINAITRFFLDKLLAIVMSKEARHNLYEMNKKKRLNKLKDILKESNKDKVDNVKTFPEKGVLVTKANRKELENDIMQIYKEKQNIFNNLSVEEKEKITLMAKKMFKDVI